MQLCETVRLLYNLASEILILKPQIPLEAYSSGVYPEVIIIHNLLWHKFCALLDPDVPKRNAISNSNAVNRRV